MRPRDFNRLMGRFYDTATNILVRHDAMVDKFVGDEVVAIFVPAMAGPAHARVRMSHDTRRRPAVPVGAAVNTGRQHDRPPRISCRRGGASRHAEFSRACRPGRPVRQTTVLSLKGKSKPVEVLVFDVGATVA